MSERVYDASQRRWVSDHASWAAHGPDKPCPGWYERPCGRCGTRSIRGVTATPLCSSCNTCRWCATGDRPAYHPHCAGCHSEWHAACGTCGQCMTAASGGARATVREDRAYCSPACRQRAYRARQNGANS
jgi:hypothetical protein